MSRNPEFLRFPEGVAPPGWRGPDPSQVMGVDAGRLHELLGARENLIACEKEAFLSPDRKAALKPHPEDSVQTPSYHEVLTLDEIRQRIEQVEAAIRSAAGR